MKFLVIVSLIFSVAFVHSKQSHLDANDSFDDVKQDFAIGEGDVIGARRDIHSQIGIRVKRRLKAVAAKVEERSFTTPDGDYLSHDCRTVKPYTKENWFSEPWNKGLSKKRFKQKKGASKYVKYNSAYGIPMIGTEKFSDDSMLRGCYLIRYIFADNQHLRIAARRSGMFNVGFKGGWCCPPQMGNNGLSCQCNSKFPLLGKGAPAHEMAHHFIKRLPKLIKDGHLKLPQYVDSDNVWKYRPAFSEDTKNCKKVTKAVKKYGELFTWMWNVQKQDRLRGTSKIKQCKMHHYFIYSGQQNWLFKGNQKVMEKSRPKFQKKSPNLYNLMEQVWPCNNNYLPVCKDASHGFKMGLAQKFIIGKVDPKDKSKMVCQQELDKAEIKPEEVPNLEQPTEDGTDKRKCLKVARTVDKRLANTARKSLPVNAFAKYLTNDEEHAWYLRRCCSKTLNFDNTIP